MEDIYSNNNIFEVHSVDSNESTVKQDLENTENKSLNPDEKLLEIEKKLQSQRNDWGIKIVNLIKQLKDIEGLSDAQVDMLSYRQMLVEQLTKFRIRSKNTSTTYEKKFKSKFISYFNYDYKINDKQKVDMVNADLHFYRRQLGLLDSQIEFFKECINTLDKMGFAIKNRVNFEEI
jgi:hypothetical protein